MENTAVSDDCVFSICPKFPYSDIAETEQADDIIRYVFTWDTNRINLKNRPCEGSLAAAVKKHITQGGNFLCGLGVIKE